MSKVALRVYNREIETLVDQGHLEEAIAHCQHILKVYPKHLETYRLLGKAYLESHRHPDAADIFQRVLVSVPDDFVSQLGISIVRDEQKDLDGAIWHMERAFEVNPSNGAVQGELRRLYGRRDGLEPPKIRLTRGALAQMYTKGGQYPQAIAEIKSLLAEDPTRIDMRVLMARALYRGGQKVEATELCIELLKQFPFCLDANRILIEVLPGTNMAQNLDTYKKRVQALEPYATQATGSMFDLDSIPDNAITIDRLDWDADAASSAFSGSAEKPNESLPDFLSTSGWGPSSGEFQDGPVDFGEDEPTPAAASSGLAAAEIPDWLKAMAPPGASAAESAEQDASNNQNVEEEDLDWLSGLGGPITAASTTPSAEPANHQPDWLNQLESKSDNNLSATPNDQPDWLKDIGGSATPSATETTTPDDSLDWLQTLHETPSNTPASSLPAAQDDSMDMDWLQNLGISEQADTSTAVTPVANIATPQPEIAQPASDDMDMDWLKGLGAPETPASSTPSTQAISAATDQPTIPQKRAMAQDDPNFVPGPLSELVSGPGTSEAEQDDAMKWLESLAANQGAKAEELITHPSERTDAVPAWAAPTSEQPAAPVTPPPAPVAQTPPPAPQPTVIQKKVAQDDPNFVPPPLSELVSGPGTSEAEQDDAMKWLEALAAKQGAKAEELITDPSERTHDMPTWAASTAEQPAAPVTPPPAPVAQTPPPAPQPTVIQKKVAQDDPNFVPPPLSELVSGPGTSASEQDDAMKWLEALAAKQGAKAEELITDPNERTHDVPTWAASTTEQPAAPVTPPPAPVAQTPPPAPQPTVVQKKVAQDDPNFVPPPLSELVSGPGTSEAEQDDAMKWLEALAAKQGAKAEELITDPSERTHDMPTWAASTTEQPVAPVAQTPPPAPEPTIVQKKIAQDDPNFVPPPLSELVSGPGTSASEQDDAMKWLESLAANQGAKAEELITHPSERTDAPPAWAASTIEEPPTTPTVPPIEQVAVHQDESGFVSGAAPDPGISASEQDDAMRWLASLAETQGAKAEPIDANAVPDWAAETQSGDLTPSTLQPEAVTTDEDTMDWLQNLAGAEPTATAGPTSVEMPANQLDFSAPAEKMPWEQEETPAQPAAEMSWEEQVSPVTAQDAQTIEAETPSNISEWLKNLDVESEAPATPEPVAETLAPVATPTEEMPDWLNSKQQSSGSDDDLPDWLKDQSGDEKPGTPMSTPEWVPDVDETAHLIFSPPLEKTPPPPPPPAPAPVSAVTRVPTTPLSPPVQPPAPVRPAVRQTGMLGDKDGPALQDARHQMTHGSMDAAITGYLKLIKRSKFIEEVIYDLKEATYTHPVDAIIWQTLGDAHMRANQLQDALDAYTKAEELLR